MSRSDLERALAQSKLAAEALIHPRNASAPKPPRFKNLRAISRVIVPTWCLDR